MRIAYPQRSRLEATIRTAIKQARQVLSRGRPVTVTLGPRGFEGSITVMIDAADPDWFDADWESSDASWFPARIRATAKGLFAEGDSGPLLCHTPKES